MKLDGHVSDESYESSIVAGILLLLLMMVMMKTMGPEVQVCWMWQSYIPRTGNSTSFLVFWSAVIQRESKVWETFGKEKTGKF